MFGLSIIELYFFTNIFYTFIIFFFLHYIIIDKILKESKELSEEQIRTAMSGFYVFSTLFGSFRLFGDLFNFIFDRKRCIWLYRVYENEDNKEKH